MQVFLAEHPYPHYFSCFKTTIIFKGKTYILGHYLSIWPGKDQKVSELQNSKAGVWTVLLPKSAKMTVAVKWTFVMEVKQVY